MCAAFYCIDIVYIITQEEMAAEISRYYQCDLILWGVNSNREENISSDFTIVIEPFEIKDKPLSQEHIKINAITEENINNIYDVIVKYFE